WFSPSLPADLILWNSGSGRDEEPSEEEAVLRQIRIRLAKLEFGKTRSASQDKSPQPRIADSNSRNAVSFSWARTTKRLDHRDACRIITLPDGRHLAVAAFVSDSAANGDTRDASTAKVDQFFGSDFVHRPL